jgi:hypothetical protein
MTCSICDNLYVNHHIWSAFLAGANTIIITKNGAAETTPE